MKSYLLLGIIAVTILGTFSTHNIFVQAGLSPIETIQFDGPSAGVVSGGDPPVTSTATCPPSHPFLIGGSYDVTNTNSITTHQINTEFDTINQSFHVELIVFLGSESVIAHALCANFNFPMNMGMVGGELLDIDSISLLVGAIGVNPVITGLVAITMGGVAAQAVWFVHQRKKKNS